MGKARPAPRTPLMPAIDGKDIRKVAALILQGWNDDAKTPLILPAALRPANLAQAYAIQEAVSEGLGAIGGWIVWNARSLGGLVCTPIPLAGIHPSPARLPGKSRTHRRLVPGIGFRIGESLPDYDAPFSRARIVAAIESGLVIAGVRQPRLGGLAERDALTALADSAGYAALVHGPGGIVRWDSRWDAGFLHGRVRVVAAGEEIAARSMEAGRDVAAALVWLAHEGSRWAGGLQVGQLVMVGTETGEIEIPQNGSLEISIEDLGSGEIRTSAETGRHPRARAIFARRLRPPWRS